MTFQDTRTSQQMLEDFYEGSKDRMASDIFFPVFKEPLGGGYKDGSFGGGYKDGSFGIDDTPLNLTSGIAGDSARFKGKREHFHQRITTLTPNNDPRLKTVPEAGGGGGGSSGPAQSWS